MGRVRNWVQSNIPLLPLLFSRAELELYEDVDYPDDPAPFLVFYWRVAHVASVCRCGRQRPADQFTLRLEREDALAFAAAIQRHYRDSDSRAQESRRLQSRIEQREKRAAG